jgi:hypothetical protein
MLVERGELMLELGLGQPFDGSREELVKLDIHINYIIAS